MTETTILWGVIVLLTGVIIGGAGGSKLVRKSGKMLGMPEFPPLHDSTGPELAAKAAKDAISAATKQFRAELNTHVSVLSDHVQGMEKAINATNSSIAKVDAKVERLLGVCGERHKQIDRDFADLKLASKERGSG